ncbi:hypothetical protein RHMOL_Rhmol04G0163400 [Rhododendron molle]|uniref:Uncharacterized protein n=1 Tax=Rhododendron molle TaxID=49168 RepID=A0ACC0P2E6_RHOML|nr:hypothetical protein RHMOL_Rhmol04G0163400 [Rhododendron molle]
MASHLPQTRRRKKRTIVDLDAYNFHDEVQFLYSSPSCKKTQVEIGESSNSPSSPVMIICEICIVTKLYWESFAIMGCTQYSYCSDCVTKYVSSKLDQNITQIRCPVPDCNRAFKKFYCPYKDCSAFMIDGDDGDGEGEAIAQVECPYCNRYFCAQCKVMWHQGIDCSEFQKLHEDEREREDIMLMNL